MENAMRLDQYNEHPLHNVYNKLCSTCFSENRLIQAHKTVNKVCEICEGKGYYLKTEWSADDEDYEVEKRCECSLE